MFAITGITGNVGGEVARALLAANFDPLPGFPEARAIAATCRAVLAAARPARHRTRALGVADADRVPAAGMVHGELHLGRGRVQGLNNTVPRMRMLERESKS